MNQEIEQLMIKSMQEVVPKVRIAVESHVSDCWTKNPTPTVEVAKSVDEKKPRSKDRADEAMAG